MQKSLDAKLADIHGNPSGSRQFILADAKDADMAFGIQATGHNTPSFGAPDSPETYAKEIAFRTLEEYRQQIREVIKQGIVDIVLMSASTCEQLTIKERLFENSHVTPAARANDTTDVHLPRGGTIYQAPARPFRSASLDHILCGQVECSPGAPFGADLGLYSVTFNNDIQYDLPTLERYKEFREEAERKGFRHFLEVFDPNIATAVPAEATAAFINDLIARTLAGVTSAGRPIFLKIVYHGPQAMEELVRYDPHLVVGVLGGAAGTSLDAFTLLHQARKYGARAALFGRKINSAENQLAFIEFLRLVADDVLTPEEAVRAYHAVLETLKIKPRRALGDDLVLQTNVMSYGRNPAQVAVPAAVKNPEIVAPKASRDQSAGAAPNFATMTPEERLEYHRARLKKTLG